MTIVAGVDGCRTGWVVARCEAGRPEALAVCVAPDIEAVIGLRPAAAIIAVDMPIGLLDAAVPGGRPCDPEARRHLRGRASSVFTPPVRAALRHIDNHAEAVAANRASSSAGLGVGIQCFHLFPKLVELDAAMTPARQRKVKEAHPELAFAALNGGAAVRPPKRSAEGRDIRAALLEAAGFRDLDTHYELLRGTGAARDDFHDACVLAWTANRILRGEAKRLPEKKVTRDGRGLLMEIWF